MGVDFNINLARNLVSQPERRVRFYHAMLVYLVLCGALMVWVARFSVMNVLAYLDNWQQRSQIEKNTLMATGLDESVFRNPELLSVSLENEAERLASLEAALRQRIQLLPIMYNLFLEMPADVRLQSFVAGREGIKFGLVMDESGDAVRTLRASWEANEDISKRMANIRPLTGERRTVGTNAFYYVQFEGTF